MVGHIHADVANISWIEWEMNFFVWNTCTTYLCLQIHSVLFFFLATKGSSLKEEWIAYIGREMLRVSSVFCVMFLKHLKSRTLHEPLKLLVIKHCLGSYISQAGINIYIFITVSQFSVTEKQNIMFCFYLVMICWEIIDYSVLL